MAAANAVTVIIHSDDDDDGGGEFANSNVEQICIVIDIDSNGFAIYCHTIGISETLKKFR